MPAPWVARSPLRRPARDHSCANQLETHRRNWGASLLGVRTEMDFSARVVVTGVRLGMLDVVQCGDVLLRPHRAGIESSNPES